MHFGHNKNGQNKKHSPMGHMLMMVLCCGLPILLFLMLPWIISIYPAASALLFVIPFLCPVLMGLMMFMMMKGHGKEQDCCGDKEAKKTTTNEPLPLIKDNNE